MRFYTFKRRQKIRTKQDEKDEKLYKEWIEQQKKLEPTGDEVTERDLRALETLGFPAGKTPERPLD